jgi:hypothetical protein
MSGANLATGDCDDVDPTTDDGSCGSEHRQRRATGLGGLFLLPKIINRAGYITQPPSIIPLTEAVFATTSVKATINRDLLAEAVAKTASVNPKCRHG